MSAGNLFLVRKAMQTWIMLDEKSTELDLARHGLNAETKFDDVRMIGAVCCYQAMDRLVTLNLYYNQLGDTASCVCVCVCVCVWRAFLPGSPCQHRTSLNRFTPTVVSSSTTTAPLHPLTTTTSGYSPYL